MNKLKIALVQHKTKTTDVQENTALALRYIAEAKQANADFILFPECFLTSYMFPEICETLQPVETLENDSAFRAWCENALHDECDTLKLRLLLKGRYTLKTALISLTGTVRCS